MTSIKINAIAMEEQSSYSMYEKDEDTSVLVKGLKRRETINNVMILILLLSTLSFNVCYFLLSYQSWIMDNQTLFIENSIEYKLKYCISFGNIKYIYKIKLREIGLYWNWNISCCIAHITCSIQWDWMSTAKK